MPKALVGLRFAVAAPFVVEPREAFLGVPVRGPDHRRPRDVELLGDLGAGLAQPEPRDDLEVQRRRGVAALATHLEQIAALRPANSG